MSGDTGQWWIAPGTVTWTVAPDSTPPAAPTVTTAPADPSAQAATDVAWTVTAPASGPEPEPLEGTFVPSDNGFLNTREVRVDVPDDVEGEAQLFSVGTDGRAALRATFGVDTRAPLVVEAVAVPRPADAPPPFRTDVRPKRKFFRLTSRDGGSGVKALQLAPRPGVMWCWRSFVERFSAPVHSDSIRVRVVDRAGNVSDWFTVPVASD